LYESTITRQQSLTHNHIKENVETHAKKILKDDVSDVSSIVAALQKQRDQFDLMEKTKLHKKENLKKKIPEISKTLEAVEFLKKKKEDDEDVNTHFQIAENIYVNAKVNKTDNVALWLGVSTLTLHLLNTNLYLHHIGKCNGRISI
jgi:TPP-dependent indolepyruvate ferredoxin oxidoreductase alpha subunit